MFILFFCQYRSVSKEYFKNIIFFLEYKINRGLQVEKKKKQFYSLPLKLFRREKKKLMKTVVKDLFN